MINSCPHMNRPRQKAARINRALVQCEYGPELPNRFAYTVDDTCWEVPASSVKPGQSPEEASGEELREEIGDHSEK